MKTTIVFAEGVGAGAGAVLVIAALIVLSRARLVESVARRFGGASAAGRPNRSARHPANYLDLCRAAGL
jgi:hypothetical protein